MKNKSLIFHDSIAKFALGKFHHFYVHNPSDNIGYAVFKIVNESYNVSNNTVTKDQ